MPEDHHDTPMPCSVDPKMLLELLQVGALVIDCDGKVAFANNAMGKILGLDPQDVPNHDLSRFFDSQTIKFFLEPKQREPVCTSSTWNCLLHTASGEVREISLSTTPCWHGEGPQCYCCVALVTDVTLYRRKEQELQRLVEKQATLLELGAGHLLRADEAIEYTQQNSRMRDGMLRQSEEGYQALFKASPIPTFAWKHQNGDFILTDVNRAADSLMAARARDYLGVSANEFFGELPQVLQDMRTSLSERRIVTRELEYHGFTGENIYLLWYFAYVPPDLVLLYAQDIHERKLSEIALDQLHQESRDQERKSRERLSGALEELKSEKALRVSVDNRLQEQRMFLREVIDLSPNPIGVLDWDGNYILANQAMGQFLGHEPEQLIGRRLKDVAPWLGNDRLKENRLIMTTLESKVIEECMEDFQGHKHWFRTYKRPLVVESGMDQRVLIVAMDITEERSAREQLLRERDLLKRTMETSPDGILVITRDCKVEFANDQAVKLLGLPKNWKTSRRLAKKTQSGCGFKLNSLPLADAFQSGKIVREAQVSVEHDQETLLLSVNVAPLNDGNAHVERAIVTLQDITQRVKSEEKIKMLSLAMDQSPASVIIVDENDCIEYVNARFTEVTGYTQAEVLGQSPLLLRSGRHPDEFFENLAQTVHSGREWRGEICNLTKDGSEVWMLVSISPIFDGDHSVRRFVAVEEDITQKKLEEDQLRHLAVHDSLTGLANRLLFMDHLNMALAQAERSQSQVTVLFMDLDDFKEVNDTLGHDAGDELLKEVANRISGCLRTMDTAARLGGDEFVVLIPDVVAKDNVEIIAQRLLDKLSMPYRVKGGRQKIGASMGISVYPQDGQSPETLIRKADLAMYRAKQKGVNQYAFADET